jgi:hypothetical protein
MQKISRFLIKRLKQCVIISHCKVLCAAGLLFVESLGALVTLPTDYLVAYGSNDAPLRLSGRL